eukprot:TRINITY_DN13364_c0_g1_i6.p1 TRINITY_DN13364_c0_g1~~TRINITY_DN13364_c0_g1_i6.p1  ORF type:complete len:109 (+),score=30.15 TRINITY_DN13364_c0_g1_i6:96-422(+)
MCIRDRHNTLLEEHVADRAKQCPQLCFEGTLRERSDVEPMLSQQLHDLGSNLNAADIKDVAHFIQIKVTAGALWRRSNGVAIEPVEGKVLESYLAFHQSNHVKSCVVC